MAVLQPTTRAAKSFGPVVRYPRLGRAILSLFFLFCPLPPRPAAAEERASLQLLPFAEYSDPLGLTFHLKFSPDLRVGDLQPKDVEAYWVPPDLDVAAVQWDAAEGALAVAAYRAGHFVAAATDGWHLHVRRVPGLPAQPQSRLLIRLTRPGLGNLIFTPTLPDAFQQKPVDVVLLLDESLSMKKNDRSRLRVAAARAFAALAAGGERIGRIGIVAFNHQARLILPLTAVSGREQLFAAADRIGSSGETDMDGAIRLGLKELAAEDGTEKVAVLLTDGKDQPGIYEDAHRAFVERGWAIHAIGLSGKADHETLRRIAGETGGRYHDAASSDDLQRIFGSICFAIQKRSILRRADFPFGDGESLITTLGIDRTIRNVTITASGGTGISHALRSPRDLPAAEQTAGGEGGFRYFDLWNPEPGYWKLESRCASGKSTPPVHLEATAITILNLWHFPLSDSYEWGEPVPLTAGIALGNRALLGVSLEAQVKYPGGTARPLIYHEQGDLYRATFIEGDLVGEYGLTLRATGKTPEGDPLEREVQTRFRIVETRAPRLWISAARLDFGSLCPGESAHQNFDVKLITAQPVKDQPFEAQSAGMQTAEGVALSPEALRFLPDPFTISSRAMTRLAVELHIPERQPAGEYSGLLKLYKPGENRVSTSSEPRPTTLELHVRVLAPTLGIEPDALDFGRLQSGETKKLSLRANLQPGGDLPLQFTLAGSEKDDEQFAPSLELPGGGKPDRSLSLLLPPETRVTGKSAEASFDLRSGRHATPGPRRWALRVSAGEIQKEIPVRFELAWPELAVSPREVDFGQIFCGQTVEASVQVSHNSLSAENISLLPLESETAGQAYLECGESARAAAKLPENPTSTISVPLRVSPPLTGRPGVYAGNIRVAAWFGHQDIAWKVRIDVSKGFVLATPWLTFADLRPGTAAQARVRVISTIPVKQTITVRVMPASLPQGVEVQISPARLELAAEGQAELEVSVAAGEDAVPGTFSCGYQLRGPYNSSALGLKGEVLPRPVPIEAVKPETGPSTEELPTFSVSPETLDLGEIRPGERAEAPVRVMGNRPQTIEATVQCDSGPENCFSLSATQFELRPGLEEVVTLACIAAADAPAGECKGRVQFRNEAQQERVVSLTARVKSLPTLAESPAAPTKVEEPLKPAAKEAAGGAGGILIPSWMHHLFWALLTLLALLALVYLLRWVFSFRVPEMTKFYLASGILHVLFALIAAIYYLEAKMVVVDQPEMLRVALDQQPPSVVDSMQRMLESPAMPSLVPGEIQVQGPQAEVKMEHQSADASEGEKKATAVKSAEAAAQIIEMQKKEAEMAQDLARLVKDETKTLARAKELEVSRPPLQMSFRETTPEDEEKAEASPVELERETEEPLHDRSKAEVKPEEARASDLSPSKPEEETAALELASPRADLPAHADAASEEVETPVEKPTEKKTLVDTAKPEAQAQEVGAARVLPAAARAGKSAASVKREKSSAAQAIRLEQPASVAETGLAAAVVAVAETPAASRAAGVGTAVEVVSPAPAAKVSESGAPGEGDPAASEVVSARMVSAGSARRSAADARAVPSGPAAISITQAVGMGSAPGPSSDAPGLEDRPVAEPSAAPAASESPDLWTKTKESVEVLAKPITQSPQGAADSAEGSAGVVEAAHVASANARAAKSAVPVKSQESSAQVIQLAQPASAVGEGLAAAVTAVVEALAPSRSGGQKVSIEVQSPAPAAKVSKSGAPGRGDPAASEVVSARTVSAGGARRSAAEARAVASGPAAISVTEAVGGGGTSEPSLGAPGLEGAPDAKPSSIPPAETEAVSLGVEAPEAKRGSGSAAPSSVVEESQQVSTAGLKGLKTSGRGRTGAKVSHASADGGGEANAPAIPLSTDGMKEAELVSAGSGPASQPLGSPASARSMNVAVSPPAVDNSMSSGAGPAAKAVQQPTKGGEVKPPRELGNLTRSPVTVASGRGQRRQVSAPLLAAMAPAGGSGPSLSGGDPFNPSGLIAPSGHSTAPGYARPAGKERAVASSPAAPSERKSAGSATAGEVTPSVARVVGISIQGPPPGHGKTASVRASELAPAETILPAAIAPAAALARPSKLHALPLGGPAYSGAAGKKMSRFMTYLARYSGSNPVFDGRQERAMSFLADEVDRRLDFILSGEMRVVDLSDRQQVMRSPWLFLTGEFSFEFTEVEVRHLREFIETGGWLWVDDCTTDTDRSFDESVRRQMQLILPEAKFFPLPMDHPLFSSCYDLRNGYLGYEIPPGDKYRENRLHAWLWGGRPAVIYSRNDYGCALEFDPKSLFAAQKSLTDLSPAEMQNASVMMSMNLAFYFLGGLGGMQGLTSRVAEAAAQDSRNRIEHQAKFHQLFVKGAALPPFEDFESGSAAEWKPIGQDQVTEKAWNDIDVAQSALAPGRTGTQFELTYPLKKGKTVFERQFPDVLNLSDAQGVLVDIENKSSSLVRVSAAFVTMPGWQYFETEPAFIKPGLNKDVLFYLIGNHFKSAATDWEYRARLENPEDISRVLFLVYAIQPGTLAFDTIRLSRVNSADIKQLIRLNVGGEQP